jgi:2-keto-4-pentenoate hydratase/2-oxohepta-3-ene-1,7-dioic acid hydratase in catechol pathway
MFDDPVPSDYVLRLSDVELLMPVQPTKVIALWNNFGALGQKLKLATPPEPLYLVKTANSYLGPNQTIRKPRCEGKVAFEGELAIVIGKTCSGASEAQAMDHVFGYTCANDVTVSDILNRAKSFDTFCPFGPVVATGLDPASLVVNTILNGELRQDYPISDMLFSVAQLVSLISQDMTLYPGDLILCGTSVGVGSMKPGSTIEVEIAGIGRLTNRFE